MSQQDVFPFFDENSEGEEDEEKEDEDINKQIIKEYAK